MYNSKDIVFETDTEFKMLISFIETLAADD